MKIQCDVCNKEEAAVFCSADEAALCSACDHRVHHANKLAGKHHRFSLLHPPPKQDPLCDICQEKRAFLFCQQDRAILCKDCDIPIHRANEHTQKHNRFLLTGVKLSPSSSVYSPNSSSSISSNASLNNNIKSGSCDIVPNLESKESTKKPVSAQLPTNPNNLPIMATHNNDNNKSVLSSNHLTSVSEYLMEMPGWHVEELLDPSSPAPFGLAKGVDALPIWDVDLDNNLGSISSPESIGVWVPQAPSPLYPFQYPSSNISFSDQINFKEKEISGNKTSKKWRDDSSFTVPQINPPPSSAPKRSRIYW